MTSLSQPLGHAFWNTTGDYLFRSCWPASSDLLSLFSQADAKTKTDRFLDAGCGPGDFSIEAARAGLSRACIGIDYSTLALRNAQSKAAQMRFIRCTQVWGRLFGLWIRGDVDACSIVFVARSVSAGTRSLDRLNELRTEMLDCIRRYVLASPHSALVERLQAMGILDLKAPGCGDHFLRAALEVDNSEGMRRLVNSDYNSASNLFFATADLTRLPFPDAAFGRVLLSEIEPLLSRRHTDWISDVVRVCDSGGVILYAGARVSPGAPPSAEMVRTRSMLEAQASLSIVGCGLRRLASGWDPVFNDPKLNDKVLTPYVLAMKR